LPTPELSIQFPVATASYLVAISSQSSLTADPTDSLNYNSVGEKVTLQLAVHRQPVRLEGNPLENHDQYFLPD
jgi:hypothetical protein